MHPVCFEIGRFPIHCFGLLMALGFLAGLLNWTWLGRKEGRTFNYCSDLLFWIMVAGILGARLAYVLSDLDSFLAAPATIVRVDQGGLVFYGGLLGALLAIVIFARAHREPVWSVLDFVVTSLPLAHAFGRVGCFLNGCCFGTLSDAWCAVRYPAGSPAWWAHVQKSWIHIVGPESRVPSLPVHPVQLYESLFNLGVYALLLRVYRKRRYDGATAGVYLLAYPLGRFVLEFFRGDDRLLRGATRLSAAQFTSLALFIVGCAILLYRRRQATTTDTGRERT